MRASVLSGAGFQRGTFFPFLGRLGRTSEDGSPRVLLVVRALRFNRALGFRSPSSSLDVEVLPRVGVQSDVDTPLAVEVLPDVEILPGVGVRTLGFYRTLTSAGVRVPLEEGGSGTQADNGTRRVAGRELFAADP